MKKQIKPLIFISLLTTLMVGCGKKTLNDGTYTAQDLNYDAHGWKAYVTITVSNGKISDADFDYVAEDGTTKSNNPSYAERMSASAGVTPDEYIEDYTKQLIESQDAEKVDAITGATTAYKDFKTLATEAINASLAGNTNTIEIELFK